jgi:hypothetical protein
MNDLLRLLEQAEQQYDQASRSAAEAKERAEAAKERAEAPEQQARRAREEAAYLAEQVAMDIEQVRSARRNAQEAAQRAADLGTPEAYQQADFAAQEANQAARRAQDARQRAEQAEAMANQSQQQARGLRIIADQAAAAAEAAASRKRDAEARLEAAHSARTRGEEELSEARQRSERSEAEARQAETRLQELQEAEGRCGGRSGVLALIAAIPSCLPESSSEEEGHSFPSVTLNPSQFLFIDPILAIGYDYVINSGSTLISQVLLPLINGTSSYDLVGDSSGGACASFTTPLGSATPGVPFAFSTPVPCFGVRGIQVASALDPNDPLAFVTGILGSSTGTVNLSQIPITINTDTLRNPTGAPAPLPLLGVPLAWRFSRRLRGRTAFASPRT